ncbi:MAG: DUF1549 and DUF1553 domain-containing protein [Planctomycetaceae bacterium]
MAAAFLPAVAAFGPNAFAGDDGPAPAVSFQHDVMAVLSRAGCNQGICHGNKNGKGGFRLSLRGENPAADFAMLTRDLSSRRVNVLDPEQSLLLLKPVMQTPHEGGRRLSMGSREYEILRSWIAAGMPADRAQLPHVERLTVEPAETVLKAPVNRVELRAVARFSDGTTRDVTRLASYETTLPSVEVDRDGVVRAPGACEVTVIVRYLNRQAPVRLAFISDRPEFVWRAPEPANFIDQHVFARLKSLSILPSGPIDDATFLRRAYLDLLGVLPSADEAQAFDADARSEKRARLVEALLERPEFAECWAAKWSDLLRNEEKTLDRKGVEAFHGWIRRSLEQNVPLDQFARELIASRGSTYQVPAANYWRGMRDTLTRAESTAQLFLGVRLQCAKCHNHPFDRWTQDDYYAWANLFSRVKYRVLENHRRDENDRHEFDGEQIVCMAREGNIDDPRTNAPPKPRFLGTGAQGVPGESDRLLALAGWIAQPDNRLFADAQANRIWYHLMGQGIVDPVDDFRATNPPSNPALLEALSHDLVSHKFDLRHMIRTIMQSHTYQSSCATNDTNRDDETKFSHARERRLPAEVLLDAISQVVEAPLEFAGYPVGIRAGALPGVQAVRVRDAAPRPAEQFLKIFGKPPRLQSCECERSTETTLAQTFQLVSGTVMTDLLSRPDNRLGRLLTQVASDRQIVDELYWAALSRAPSSTELAGTLEYLGGSPLRRERLEDVLWGLLNSNEFLMRR